MITILVAIPAALSLPAFARLRGGALSPAQQLLAKANSGPLFVTDAATRADLERLATAAEASGAGPVWPRDAEALCRRWKLIATTNAGPTSALLQRMDADPSLGTVKITQRWRLLEDTGELRCDNAITIGRADGDLRSAWTLLPVGGSSSLVLQHAARLVDGAERDRDGGGLRMALDLDAAIVDGTREGGGAAERIVALPIPPQLPGLPPPPSLPIPGLAEALAEAGVLEITWLDDELWLCRGKQPAPFGGEAASVLRVFAPDS